MNFNKQIIYIILIFFFSLIFINFAQADWCKYKSEIEECISANDAWKSRSIEDFVCIVGSDEEITYQVVLDKFFKDLDDEMDQYIETLEKEKNTYFWIGRKKTFIDGLNDIDDQKKYFYKEYSDICWAKIMEEVISCNKWTKTAIVNAGQYFQETDCIRLVDKKLDIFDEVTFSILMLNKQQIKADEKKTYDQWERTNYNRILDLMMVNLWYIERIWQKWPSKIQNAY